LKEKLLDILEEICETDMVKKDHQKARSGALCQLSSGAKNHRF
jgi:hypothetical protein